MHFLMILSTKRLAVKVDVQAETSAVSVAPAGESTPALRNEPQSVERHERSTGRQLIRELVTAVVAHILVEVGTQVLHALHVLHG